MRKQIATEAEMEGDWTLVGDGTAYKMTIKGDHYLLIWAMVLEAEDPEDVELIPLSSHVYPYC